MLSADRWYDAKDPGVFRAWGAARLIVPDVPDEHDYQQMRRRQALRAEHPEIVMGTVGDRAQATVPLENGSQTITRRTWRELLDKIREMIPAPD